MSWESDEDPKTLSEESLKGAMMRALNMHLIRWGRDEAIQDLSINFGRVTEAEKSELTQQCLQAWSRVEMIAV